MIIFKFILKTNELTNWFILMFNQSVDEWNAEMFSGSLISVDGSPDNATDRNNMLNEAKTFNPPLEKWNVCKVASVKKMYAICAFNQSINCWKLKEVGRRFVQHV